MSNSILKILNHYSAAEYMDKVKEKYMPASPCSLSLLELYLVVVDRVTLTCIFSFHVAFSHTVANYSDVTSLAGIFFSSQDNVKNKEKRCKGDWNPEIQVEIKKKKD